MNGFLFWLSIVASVCSIIAIIWNIVDFLKKKQYPAEITCDIIDNITISAPKKLGKSKISLLIDGQQTDKQLHYIKYLLVSVGNRDVVCNEEDKIEFKLPPSGNWVSFDVINESQAVGANTEIKNNCAFLKASKLRVNESIVLEGVYECSDDGDIKVSHRIQNTRNIKIKETLLETSIEERLFNIIRAICTCVILFMTIGICEIVLPISPNYYVKKDGTTRVYVEAQLKDINTIYVKEPGHAYDAPEPETMTYTEFAQNYTKYEKTGILIRNSYCLFFGMISALGLMIIIQWIGPIRRSIRRHKNKEKYKELILAAKN